MMTFVGKGGHMSNEEGKNNVACQRFRKDNGEKYGEGQYWQDESARLQDFQGEIVSGTYNFGDMVSNNY